MEDDGTTASESRVRAPRTPFVRDRVAESDWEQRDNMYALLNLESYYSLLESDSFKSQPGVSLGFGGSVHVSGLRGRYPVEAAAILVEMCTGAYMPPAEFRTRTVDGPERQAEEEAVRRSSWSGPMEGRETTRHPTEHLSQNRHFGVHARRGALGRGRCPFYRPAPSGAPRRRLPPASSGRIGSQLLHGCFGGPCDVARPETVCLRRASGTMRPCEGKAPTPSGLERDSHW